ncbi:uncharacterized protein F5147DRAFT_775871 [Suillus discolor]|uniref:Uncharacterized protein n=1 Tax=Suillus discolor TaxID=1912936 RepID=A0A9P7F2J4_9AGAM|nr:uncharacterized protein F5147DRAFT_775871 [Suillus discolor]KAG2103745.1 hypothetical protein F5147DRAFT_775871 [Suillus discolor]
MSDPGVGPGVMCAVFEHALTDMCEDAKLCRRRDGHAGYFNLNTTSVVCTPHHQADNEAFGFLAAAHLFLTGHGPHPLSPAIIIFCIAGYDGLFDLELIGQVLPDSMGLLKKWALTVPATTEIFIGSDITTLGIDHLDASPSEILEAVSNDRWRSLTEAFYSAILFGDMGAATSSAMTNFKQGFNIRVSDTQSLCDTLCDCYKTILPGCYGRMIRGPTCVISKIAFRSASSNIDRRYSSTSTPEDSLAISRQLQAIQPTNFMAESERNKDKDDPTLRSCLFMRFCTGSQLMPHRKYWEIKLSFVSDLLDTKAHFILQNASSDWKPEPLPLFAHTCTGDIEVALNSTLIKYITEALPPNDDGRLVTWFDVWIHSNLM